MNRTVTAITALNTVALLGLGASLFLLGGAPTKAKSASKQTSQSPAQGSSAELTALRKRVLALELELATLQSKALAQPKVSAKPEEPAKNQIKDAALDSAKPVQVDTEAPSEDDHRPLTRADFDDYFDKAWKKKQKQQQKVQQQAWRKEKRSVRQMVQELELDAEQEKQVRNLYQDVSRDSMKVLFGLESEKQLQDLKNQLQEAEHNPELKAKLREQLQVNWIKNQKDMSVLYVKFDAQMRRIMSHDKVMSFYKYNVRPENAEFPDIQEMFFQPQKPEDKKQ